MAESTQVVELFQSLVSHGQRLDAPFTRFLNPPVPKAETKVFEFMDKFDPNIKLLYQLHNGENMSSEDIKCLAQLFIVPGWYWLPQEDAVAKQHQVDNKSMDFFPLFECGGMPLLTRTTVT